MAEIKVRKRKKSKNIFTSFFSAFIPGKSKKKMRREDAIVVTNEINSINECYNTLKTNLLYMSNENLKVIQVESSVSGEGKTTMGCNLAVSMSFNDKKVLVIDLDFRKPRINRLFNVLNENGLVDYMSEKITFDQLIKKTSYDNVDVITHARSSAKKQISDLEAGQMSLSFGPDHSELVEKLRGIRIDELRPVDALNILAELKDMI